MNIWGGHNRNSPVYIFLIMWHFGIQMRRIACSICHYKVRSRKQKSTFGTAHLEINVSNGGSLNDKTIELFFLIQSFQKSFSRIIWILCLRFIFSFKLTKKNTHTHTEAETLRRGRKEVLAASTYMLLTWANRKSCMKWMSEKKTRLATIAKCW